MEFLTPVPVLPCSVKISYTTPVLMLGSCFSDSIGGLMKEERFPVLSNPFGVLYNPFSVSLLIKRSLSGEELRDDEIFTEGGVYKSFLFHSSFAAQSAGELKKKAGDALSQTAAFIKQASFLIITLGTARYYRHNASSCIVANCHKQPRGSFAQVLATPEECSSEISETIKALRAVNPDIFVIFTISPVRYLKDGSPGAQQDKAALFVALQQWLQLPRTCYFPSYEILIDELRDYRFYADDMVHPSEKAINYIYDRFGNAFFSPATKEISAKVKRISLALQHRPMFPESDSHKEFVLKAQKELEMLKKEHPEIR